MVYLHLQIMLNNCQNDGKGTILLNIETKDGLLELLDVYCILYFLHLLGGFLHICALYIYYICGLWPSDNASCLFLTWY
jgi:hypothetical protein